MSHSIRNVLPVAALLFAASACVAQPSASLALFLPGIATNDKHTMAFAAGLDGRLVAIRLADGSIRWHSQRALEALGFANAVVIASATVANCAHCVQLVWVSTEDGLEQRTSRTITFPDWVSVEPAAGKQFTARVEADAESMLLHWSAHSRYVGGANPTSQILADFKKDASGTFIIDPQGNATAATNQSRPAVTIPATLRDVKSTTWWNCSNWRDVPVADYEGMVAFDLSSRPDGQTLSARRWRLPSGQLDATRQLAQGTNLELQISPDSRYLFVHDGALQSDAKASISWHVYSLSTLRPVASIPYPAGQACANVAADTVVMLTGKSSPSNRVGTRSRNLLGYATSNGELRWTVELRGDPQQPRPR